MTEPSVWSLLPPAIAIVLAIATRQVYLSLGLGILVGSMLLTGSVLGGFPLTVQLIVGTITDPESAMVLLFTFLIGTLIATMQSVGGTAAFIRWMEQSGWLKSKRATSIFVWVLGVVIFIEGSLTILVAGALARPLFDKFRIAREKLAYLIDSTAAPVCILIPLNAWGAYNVNLLSKINEPEPVQLFISAIPYSFYSIVSVGLAFVVATFDWNIGPMKAAEARTQAGKLLSDGAQPMMDESTFAPPPEDTTASPWLMLIPILTLLIAMPAGLWITGEGSLEKGDGALSVLWAVLLGIALIWALYLRSQWRRPSKGLDELVRFGIKGAQGMLPLALIILLALTLGDLTKQLGTGVYVAEWAQGNISPSLMLPLTFLVAAGTAFSTGTSWGTFAIMIPIAVPAAGALGVAKAPFLAAAMAGGIFGDHASPISDTTIMSSMVSATDHIDHVRTQLPYAMIAGGTATLGYFLVGLAL